MRAGVQAAPGARHDDLPDLPVLAAGARLERLRGGELPGARVPGGALALNRDGDER